jgi:hypothetical protein
MSPLNIFQLGSYLLVFISMFGNLPANAQSITPHILNNGGGAATSMEWSIGEGVSIAPFLAGGLALNTGVLQPMTNIVTGINEYGPAVFGNQITVGPNPVSKLLHFKARLSQVGNLSIQLIDAKSAIVYTHEAGIIYGSYDKDIQMQGYPDGVMYVRVFFKPNNSASKIGVYKIIKIAN